MENVLEELFSQYNSYSPEPATQHEIEEAHQQFIRGLEKLKQKLVPRIIDSQDLIAGARARESFKCGYWLAWRFN